MENFQKIVKLELKLKKYKIAVVLLIVFLCFLLISVLILLHKKKGVGTEAKSGDAGDWNDAQIAVIEELMGTAPIPTKCKDMLLQTVQQRFSFKDAVAEMSKGEKAYPEVIEELKECLTGNKNANTGDNDTTVKKALQNIVNIL